MHVLLLNLEETKIRQVRRPPPLFRRPGMQEGTWGVGQESKKQENYIYRRNREQRELDDYQRAQNGKYQM